jgi:hypothetical protein
MFIFLLGGWDEKTFLTFSANKNFKKMCHNFREISSLFAKTIRECFRENFNLPKRGVKNISFVFCNKYFAKTKSEFREGKRKQKLSPQPYSILYIQSKKWSKHERSKLSVHNTYGTYLTGSIGKVLFFFISAQSYFNLLTKRSVFF